MDHPDDPGTTAAGRYDLRALGALGERLAAARTVAERLRRLDEAPEAEPAVRRLLGRVSERSLLADDTLRLMKVRALRRHGAGLDERGALAYYLHAFEAPADRAEIRRALGLAGPRGPARVVCLITVDCLRADHARSDGPGGGLMPSLEQGSREGAAFARAYATAGATTMSFPGLLLSTFFQNFGASRAVPPHLTTLAEAMAAAGYRTMGVNAANVLLSHYYGYGRGFETYLDFFQPGGAEGETFVARRRRVARRIGEQELAEVVDHLEMHPEAYIPLKALLGREGASLVQAVAARRKFDVDAAEVVRLMLADLADLAPGDRRFYWLHLMDVHEPVHVPHARIAVPGAAEQILLNRAADPQAGGAPSPAQVEAYRRLYAGAVSYVDLNLGVLFNALRDAGVWADSLVCLTADHGQELFEEGRFGHDYDRVGERLVHVPLVFAGGLARGLAAADIARPVSTLDVAPTILDLCGLEAPEGFLGRTLRDPAPRPIIGQSFYHGIRNRVPDAEERRLYLNPLPRPVREHCREVFFRIADGWQMVHDRGRGRTELRPLEAAPPGPPPDAESLKRDTERILAEVYRPPEQTGRALTADEQREVARRLAHLGYL